MEYNTFNDLIKQESDVYKKTIEESPEIGWFKQFYEDIQIIINVIPQKRRENESSITTPKNYLIVTSTLKIINISNSILHLISRGYYGQGMNLLRSLQEEYHHMLFFNFHPEDQIKLWNEGRIKSDRVNQYMSTSKHIPKKWKGISKDQIKIYGELSKFVHPSRVAWGGVVQIETLTGKNIIKLLPIYESNSFRTIYVTMMIILENTLLLLLDVYIKETKKINIYNKIMRKLKQFELEYAFPILNTMRLDIGLNMIG